MGQKKCPEFAFEALLAEGHSPFIITTSKSGKDCSETINGVKVYRLTKTNIYSPYRAQQNGQS